jgi:hypothetical protein
MHCKQNQFYRKLNTIFYKYELAARASLALLIKAFEGNTRQKLLNKPESSGWTSATEDRNTRQEIGNSSIDWGLAE